ncbi:MAG: hypothetical protein V2A56_07800 [bacterium]
MHPKRTDPIWTPGQTLATPIGEVTLERQLGVGKSGYSHLAQLKGNPVVAKRMHNEPTPLYTFHDNKCALEYRAYVRLKRAGVPVPAMLHLNPEAKYLIKEYVEGVDGLEAVARGLITNEVIAELMTLSAACRELKINLDWFPANFVVLGVKSDLQASRTTQNLAYIDYEINEYADEWSFEEWGVWYWANREGVARFLETGDSAAINDPPDSGKPIRTNRSLVQKWLNDVTDGHSDSR